MMRFLILCFIGLFLVSCGASKKNTSSKPGATTVKEKPIKKPNLSDTSPSVENIIETSQQFLGTPYKFGGTTAKGMDCSGLIHTAFKEEGIALPRISRDIAKKGEKIKFQQIQKGDLLFFKTEKSNSINHVGLVVELLAGKIYFIHSSTSRGVIISSLDERYWFQSFVEARRVL